MSEYIDVYIDTTTKVPEDATEFDYELFERFMSGGPWVAHSKYMELKAENAKLRDGANAMRQLYEDELKHALAENAKLRELVADLWHLLYGWLFKCHEVPWKELEAVYDRMRELGVEVDA